jgi:hypothetical protein
MTPEQKIKAAMLTKAVADGHVDAADGINAENVNELWDNLTDLDLHWDYMSEMRSGAVETGLPCEWSRHYESKSVAAKMADGSWVGWTYWFGGGKHGAPEEVEWMSEAYELNCTEEQKTVTVQTFAKSETAPA